MSDNEFVVEMENVSVMYQTHLALKNITMKVRRGEFLALLGPNGAGKSTLIKTILGLMEPIAGTVKVFGVPPKNLGEKRTWIGYVPQVTNVDPNFPVRAFDIVLMGLYGKIGLFKRPTREHKEAAMRAMEMVGMEKLADRRFGSLSGGQQQRLLVARALVLNPKLLLLDEPTTGVDTATSTSIYDILSRLHREGITIILVSHDVGIVSQYVDQVACINQSLVVHGKPAEVLTEDALDQMYGCDAMLFVHGPMPHMVVKKEMSGVIGLEDVRREKE
jgi:zinc transport system ATP-binding protein